MALEHLDSKLAAIKRVCRALQIKVTTLEVISASDLMDMEFEPHNMLIERLIGCGVYLIAGAPKIDKSWLMLWLAHCVSTGTKVWGFLTQQSDVLYISLEDPRQRIQERLAKVTGGGVDGSLVMVKADRQDNLATLYAIGRDTLDMELELMFDEDTSTWQFLGHGGTERIQKREPLLSELNDLLTDIGSFHGTASELMAQLCARSDIQIKLANALIRQLNPYRALLEFEYGIRCEVERTAKGRTLHLTKITNDDSDDTLTHSTDTVTTVTE